LLEDVSKEELSDDGAVCLALEEASKIRRKGKGSVLDNGGKNKGQGRRYWESKNGGREGVMRKRGGRGRKNLHTPFIRCKKTPFKYVEMQGGE